MGHEYRFGTHLYDALSGERCVYRAGRELGIRMLELRPGDTVLDLGCGTGLSFRLLVKAVGPTGRVLGVDSSTAMLAQARKRVLRRGWNTVSLVHSDATRLRLDGESTDLMRTADSATVPSSVDAVFSAYALSVMSDPEAALAAAAAVTKPGGRMGIVDMQRPTGFARVLTPLALAATALGGSDIDAHPWTWLERNGSDLRSGTRRGGHIVAVAGSVG